MHENIVPTTVRINLCQEAISVTQDAEDFRGSRRVNAFSARMTAGFHRASSLSRSSRVGIPVTDSLVQAVHLHNNFFGTG